MNHFNKGEDVTDEVMARMRSNELNARRTLRSDTPLGKIVLAVAAIERDTPHLSHDNAYQLARKQQPELFR